MGVLQIVVKGPPFIPDPTGDYGCADAPNCDDMHGCNVTCTTFNTHDAMNLKSQGYPPPQYAPHTHTQTRARTAVPSLPTTTPAHHTIFARGASLAEPADRAPCPSTAAPKR